MARPRPRPPKARVDEGSAWQKESNTSLFLPSGIPTPVSHTVISSMSYSHLLPSLAFSRCASHSSAVRTRPGGFPGGGTTFTSTPSAPAGVNLIALLMRCRSTCFTWCPSSIAEVGRSAGSRYVISRPKHAAVLATWSTQSAIRSAVHVSCSVCSPCPASSLLKSSTSLTSVRSCDPHASIVSKLSRQDAGISLSALSNERVPSNPFKGVRNSWDIEDKKAILAFPVTSAARRASIIAISFSTRSEASCMTSSM
mmetsp:Transcript_32246/g.73862  ORF Transcript_32246/g.73862 Transcript_32246/m.73862 type:complete len:254 (+) Transcript_32246:260-1021(+)